MKGLSYERLSSIVNTTPPYRGNKSRFPLGRRRENRKYFLVREEEGQRVFDIVYGQRWKTHICDEATHDRMKLQNIETNRYPKYDDKGMPVEGEWVHHWYEVVPNIVGTVRSDNTFEFTSPRYSQGEKGFLSAYCYGWFTSSSRQGGMIYRHPAAKKFLPIWKGMRLNVHTMEPTTPFKVVIHHVERKKAKDLLKQYEHFFKVSEVMLKNMTMAMAVETAREVIADICGNDKELIGRYRSTDEYVKWAEERINTAPLDAFLLYATAYGIGRFAYMVRWDNQRLTETESVAELYMNTKRKVSKEIYKGHPDIFKEVEYEGGVMYPACDWGTKIIVDGKEMEQL